MRKLFALAAALLVALVLAGCGANEQPRTEPFVGQWESTGGEAIAMRVDSPTDGKYPVNISGGGVNLDLQAAQVGEGLYEAKPDTGSVWSFRMVDDELLTATAAQEGRAPVSTSFKRVGE